jgi:4-hydroxybenzoate polyprenyltransferase
MSVLDAHKGLRLATVLVRWRAWWFNKIPLSLTLMLLLLDGRPFTYHAVLALVLLVLIVCAVGNYGYALNDLYDIEQDARAGRANAAGVLGQGRLRWIIVLSAIVAELLAWMLAGVVGAALTLVEIGLPLVYSRPPWRIKERKWLGVAADALAAHVYPAVLAVLAVSYWHLRPVMVLLVVCLVAWSAAAGIRGILSHQLHTAERDRQGGLTTVVHDYGPLRLENFITFALLPIEFAGFVGAVAICDGGLVLWAFAGIYLVYEAFKTLAGGFVVTALRPHGQSYIPFVEESFYKGWGPIVIALDAARVDQAFLLVLPLYWLLFQPHLRHETVRIRAVWHAVFRPKNSGS